MALQLRELGFPNVSVLKGGWKEWIAAGNPTEKKEEPAGEARWRAS